MATHFTLLLGRHWTLAKRNYLQTLRNVIFPLIGVCCFLSWKITPSPANLHGDGFHFVDSPARDNHTWGIRCIDPLLLNSRLYRSNCSLAIVTPPCGAEVSSFRHDFMKYLDHQVPPNNPLSELTIWFENESDLDNYPRSPNFTGSGVAYGIVFHSIGSTWNYSIRVNTSAPEGSLGHLLPNPRSVHRLRSLIICVSPVLQAR